MWTRGKSTPNRWGNWEWQPDLTTLENLQRVRDGVRTAFTEYVAKCVARGECLYHTEGNQKILVPLGFTPNDFIRRVVERMINANEIPYSMKPTIFNIRAYFQTTQIAGGDYESGPRMPYLRLRNVLERIEQKEAE
jgi:hypothetical protein